MSENTNRVEMELVDVMSGYTAEQAREYMERAEKAAEEAENTYSNLLETIEQATEEAAEKAAESATELAKEYAEQAEEAAARAATEAAEAAAKEAADEVATVLKDYTAVGSVDLNDYYKEYARLYVDTGSSNAPTDTEKFFVDIDIETSGTTVRQKATGAASGAKYIRNGVIGENSVEWSGWTGTTDYFKLDGSTPMEGDIDLNGHSINGVTISSDGHIILPSGVEFY